MTTADLSPVPQTLLPQPEAALLAAPQAASRLAEILGLEFEALKTRDLTSFEALQDEKNGLLQGLASVAEWSAQQETAPVVWQQLQTSLQQSKQDHLRNIQLLQRQLQAVKGTLEALQGDSAPQVDLYNRMGQVARRSGVFAYQLA
jgi:flagellar biosynthesis/type III secretory pathway chaperone